MSSTLESRTQIVKPLLVKAGISAVLSVAAYMGAKLIAKRSVYSQEICHLDSLNTTSFNQYQEERHNASMQIIENNSTNLEEKLLDLEIHIEGLQKRERDLKRQLLQYREMKEKEFMLMEIRYKMMLEKTRAEFMLREVSSVQDESQRMGSLILEYIRVVNKLEDCKKENGLLMKKARKLCKRARQRLKIIREQKLRIEAREEVLVSNQEELQRKDDDIQEFEDKVSQMKEVIDHLQREKIEISNNLDIAHKSYSLNPKNEVAIHMTKEEHEKVLKELEQLQKDREVEANELAYLKWSNACLRHELLRFHEQNKGENEHEFELDDQQHIETENCNCNDTTFSATHDGTNMINPSRRRRFIQKVKKWVEGGKMDEKEKDEVNCFGKASVLEEGAEDMFVHGRKSCSSV
ncbi:hypothetical protein BVRB_7g161020 [Beta vulgaris subsp. vulgaris]|nr:hypothetical protein BVRB_7g161020 [Beta vulgaris subsp. vulgaris]